MWIIYKHTNNINGKVYIGLTKQDPHKRWAGGLGYYTQPTFFNAIKKYGWQNFSHEIVEEKIPTLSEANKKEQYWIKKEHSYIRDPKCNGYNMTIGGDTNQTEKLWKDEEDFILRKYYPTEGVSVITRLNDRTLSSIHNRVFCLNIKCEKNIWKEEDINTLIKYYPVEGIKCESRINNHTKRAIHKMATSLGLKHSNKVKWTDDELNVLYTYYPTEGLSILDRLPNKIYSQVVSKTNQLGIKWINKNAWSKDDIQKFKKLYTTYGIKKCRQEFPNRSVDALLQKASELHIKGRRDFSEYSKKVLCIETGNIYKSQKEALRKTGISVRKCLHGYTKTAGGYHWKYIK